MQPRRHRVPRGLPQVGGRHVFVVALAPREGVSEDVAVLRSPGTPAGPSDLGRSQGIHPGSQQGETERITRPAGQLGRVGRNAFRREEAVAFREYRRLDLSRTRVEPVRVLAARARGVWDRPYRAEGLHQAAAGEKRARRVVEPEALHIRIGGGTAQEENGRLVSPREGGDDPGAQRIGAGRERIEGVPVSPDRGETGRLVERAVAPAARSGDRRHEGGARNREHARRNAGGQ